MVNITNWVVYDLKESVISCRNAMRLTPPEYTDEEFEASLPRAIKLANTPQGSGHSTFLCGIRVAFDIKYPAYFSPELQRYHFNDIVCSSSKMHRLVNMNMDLCFNEYVTEDSKSMMKNLIQIYNRDKSYENFMRVLSNCPLGIELFMRCTTNYLALRTIYHQRKHHRLKTDWVEGFCKNFVEKLPYAEEFITGELNNGSNKSKN
jgi:hypothetical protein